MSNMQSFENKLNVLIDNKECIEWILAKELELRSELLKFFKDDLKDIEKSLTEANFGGDSAQLTTDLLETIIKTYQAQWQRSYDLVSPENVNDEEADFLKSKQHTTRDEKTYNPIANDKSEEENLDLDEHDIIADYQSSSSVIHNIDIPENTTACELTDINPELEEAEILQVMDELEEITNSADEEISSEKSKITLNDLDAIIELEEELELPHPVTQEDSEGGEATIDEVQPIMESFDLQEEDSLEEDLEEVTNEVEELPQTEIIEETAANTEELTLTEATEEEPLTMEDLESIAGSEEELSEIEPPTPAEKTEVQSEPEILHFSNEEITATSHVGPGEAFSIMKESEAVLDDMLEEGYPEALLEKRQELIKLNILVKENESYKFTQNVIFMNAMEATSIITGLYTSNFSNTWSPE